MAVYTPISRSQLIDFLDDYDLGILESHTGIKQGVENTNYHVYTDRGHFILTIFENRVSYDDLPFFFSFMEHLGEKGVRCPHPIPSRTGERVGVLADRPAAFFSFLEGKTVEPEEITTDYCAQLGVFVACLHQAAVDFPRARTNAMALPAWKKLAAETAVRADVVQPGLAALIAEELAYLEAHWPAENALPRAVVHADIFPDNVFFRGGDIYGLIDFYFSCTDFLVYDLALVMNAWCFDREHKFLPARFEALMKNYQEVRPMGAAEREVLRFMGRAAALRILMTRLRSWLNRRPEDFVKPKDPAEYIAKLLYHRDHQIDC